MKLSIVIPCYNAADTIGEQLDALARQTWPGEWEIIVANNGSTDNTLAVVAGFQARLPQLRVVDASARRGATFAYNTGAAAATGDAILFCDADDVVGDGYLAAMAAALAQYDFVAARFDSERLNEPWVRASHSNNQRDGLQPYQYPPFLPHAGGSSLGVKRALFDKIGGFDESVYLEDTDLCWRLQLAGTELHFVPNAVIHVRYRTSAESAFGQARAWGRGNVLLYRKYRPLGMPKLTRRAGLAGWWRLVKQLPLLRSKGGRVRWLRSFGWRVGRLEASLAYRIWAL